MPKDSDELDGCALEFTDEEATTNDELAMTVLFPEGKATAKQAAEWRKLFRVV